jgi:alanyl-tRNA synthetase
MDSQELINNYFRFFSQRGHTQIDHAPLATAADSSTLFNAAGMQPLIPYLIGQPHPAGRRLVNVQPCLRTNDIDEVGDTSHQTFFEMLGNWSLGDYFKAVSIEMSYEFLTQWLRIDPTRLWVTVFAGDADAPADDESPRIWEQVGLPPARIVPLGRDDNWWGPVGNTGPCGPDTEIFYDFGGPGCGPDCRPGCSCGRFLEIWNNVFMAYNRTGDGRYEPLPQQNVDTGMGVDRTITVLQGRPTAFETELFRPIVAQIEALAPNDDLPLASARIMADHLKAATFILGEGIPPSNKKQGYVARRLIRRAIDQGKRLGIEETFAAGLAEIVITIYEGRYPYLSQNKRHILESLSREEKSFNRTLRRGRRIFEQQIAQINEAGQKKLSGQNVFHLFDTYGIPLELSAEWAAEVGLEVDMAGFEYAFEAHKEISGGGKQGEFSGGLAARDEQTVRLHTATHLLHQALRDVLGPHVAQKGSHITPERLRFDFSHPAKLTANELAQVEALVNDKIEADLPVTWAEMPLEKAKTGGAIGLFEEKYGHLVKVYSIGDYSREICGGPHAQQTGQLGHFHIVREQSNGAGVRRIRAVVDNNNRD